MSETDWTVLANSLATGQLDRGATAGIDRPNGGGSFVFGFNSLAVVDGAAGLFTNQTNFAPMAKGGRIQGAIKRHPSAGATKFAPFLFIGLQGPDVSDLGYLLGLGDADPHHIVLRKGAINEGLPETIGVDGVLAIGTEPFNNDTWLHLRLDMVVNLNGDVVLNVFRNDLDSNPVGAPVFATVPGMDDLDPGSGRAFLDDALGINSGSQPFEDGRVGFAFRVEDTARRGAFDHLEIARQL
jgi:hypothetical protein